MTTYRVIYRRPFPKWRDFWAESAAERWAEILHGLGMRDVEVVSFEEDE